MRIAGTIIGGLVGVVLILVGVFGGGLGACCGGVPPAPLAHLALQISTPGLWLADLFMDLGIPTMAAMALGGALPGAALGLGGGWLALAIRNRRRDATR